MTRVYTQSPTTGTRILRRSNEQCDQFPIDNTLSTKKPQSRAAIITSIDNVIRQHDLDSNTDTLKKFPSISELNQIRFEEKPPERLNTTTKIKKKPKPLDLRTNNALSIKPDILTPTKQSPVLSPRLATSQSMHFKDRHSENIQDSEESLRALLEEDEHEPRMDIYSLVEAHQKFQNKI